MNGRHYGSSSRNQGSDEGDSVARTADTACHERGESDGGKAPRPWRLRRTRQSLINVAQAISAFGNEVLGLNSRWREVRSTGKGPKMGKNSQTPLWEFYRPILQALVALGGDATRKDIEGKLEENVGRQSQGRRSRHKRTRPAPVEGHGRTGKEAHDRRGS